MRDRANDVYRPAPVSLTTLGTGVSTVIWESPALLTNEAVDITAYIRGVFGSSVVRFVVDVSAVSVAGVASLSAPTTIVSRTIGGESGSFGLTAGNTVQLSVNDNSVHPYVWTAHVEVR